MTAAFNLSQLANNLNTAGQINATNGLTGSVSVINGGTGQSSLATNNVLLGNGTNAIQTIAPSTNGNVLTSNGTTWISAAIPNNSIGVGQTWQNLTGSRSLNVTYTNSTGKPIMFSVSCAGGGSSQFQLEVNGVTISTQRADDLNGNLSAIVPVGATYMAKTASGSSALTLWTELR